MGIYSLLLLSFGLIVILLVYSRVTVKSAKVNIVFLVLVTAYITLFLLSHHTIEKTCEILISDNITEIVSLIRSWGIAAPIMSIVLMVLQAVIAPLPAYLITAANGIIFGIVWGVIISSIGALLGAFVSFSITRWFYTNYANKILSNSRAQHYIEKMSSQHGFKLIVVSRLIPIISFDLISYAAGASKIKLSHFLSATFIGMLPATIVYTVLADKLTAQVLSSELTLSNNFILLSIIVALLLVLFWYIKQRSSNQKDH